MRNKALAVPLPYTTFVYACTLRVCYTALDKKAFLWRVVSSCLPHSQKSAMCATQYKGGLCTVQLCKCATQQRLCSEQGEHHEHQIMLKGSTLKDKKH